MRRRKRGKDGTNTLFGSARACWEVQASMCVIRGKSQTLFLLPRCCSSRLHSVRDAYVKVSPTGIWFTWRPRGVEFVFLSGVEMERR